MQASGEQQVRVFLKESLRIEGIMRSPSRGEIRATCAFMGEHLTLQAVLDLQSVYAPGFPLRDRVGMNVRVGNYIAPRGCPEVRDALEGALLIPDSYRCHVEFERLHPFMDGNGRTGRTVWAWWMAQTGQDPFALSFLHAFYYQTLERAGEATNGER